MGIDIIVTVGPSSFNKKTIQKMDVFGAGYFRINLSHTEIEEFEPLVNKLKQWTNKKICLDTEGGQLRIGKVFNNKLSIKYNEVFTLNGNYYNTPDNCLKVNINTPGNLLSIRKKWVS
jgi:pyruvate kinase